MTTPTETVDTEPSDGPVLTPVLGYRWALKLSHLGVTFLFGLLLLFLNILPLRGTDVWGHVHYGRWIMAHHALPAEDPIQPLAKGMQVIDTAWLSQVVLAEVERLGGGAGLSNLFAVVVWSTYFLLARVFLRQSRSLLVMTLGTVLTLGVGWSRLATIRPEIFSLLCLAVLLWLLARRDIWSQPGDNVEPSAEPAATTPGLLNWIAIPVLFAMWVNLHGTFVGGLVVLVCYALGRGVDVFLNTRSVGAVLADRAFQAWVLLAEVAIAATLVNPYGIDLWFEVARFSSNPVLNDITEWAPMVMTAVGGREFVVGVVALIFVLRVSQRRMLARESLLLLAFGLLALTQVRMIGWFAPVLAFVVVPHLADILWRWWPAQIDEAALAATLPPGEMPPGRSFRYTLVCATIAWVFFAMSGVGGLVLGETKRSDKSLYGDVPLGLTEYLAKHPVEGQLYNPQWWGDWLAVKGPAGLKPFVTTNMHLVPKQVWNDYRRISSADGPFDVTLDRYAVSKVIVDKELQPMLAAAMPRQTAWVLEYEDDQAALYRRAARNAEQTKRPESAVAAEPAKSDEPAQGKAK